ncbi:MAG: GIY-YIG nuclease family protein [Bacteroidia bacterium]|nr:GIY-YIG nuclease family protein [Bacteroidia bacterium]
MYHLYIIYSVKLNRYYIGHTENLEKRLFEHNNGISTYTSKASDWELKYKEAFVTREESHKREREIKKKKSRVYIEKLIISAG